MKYEITVDGDDFSVEVAEQPGGGAGRSFKVDVDGKQFEISVKAGEKPAAPRPSFSVSAAKQESSAPAPATKKEQPAQEEPAADGVSVEAPMAGKIVAVNVKPGDEVKEGDVVAVLEAMKMENSIASTTGGKVSSVAVSVGDVMQKGDVLCTISTGG